MTAPRPGPELWAGVECSMVRVGDDWRDQLRETGHRDRPDDLRALAATGVRTLRHPILWEHVAPAAPERCGWGWHDERLTLIRDLGMSPVAGLVHHGSGPRYTGLLDPGFAAGLARHAGMAARRYPWIRDWTPVNEPLTTARFAGLYGHWHPHERDEDAMLRMLANECHGTAMAMRAIRRAIPGARLVQTEDIGRVFAGPGLEDQARHENERRWLGLDLLCGRVDRHHPWHGRFLGAGVAGRVLDDLRGGDGMPDVVGVNHYVTSDRYLDPRVWLHPKAAHGGNGRDRYADVEAVRMLAGSDGDAPTLGWRARLTETWQRYRLPIAITEVHLGDGPEEQLRWLMEAWRAALALRDAGAEVRAVTVWAAFGSVDWDSLLTRRGGRRETGCLGLSPAASTTLLAEAMAGLVRDGAFDHDALREPGWWRRADRFLPAARVAEAA